MLRVEQISKNFGGQAALKDVSFAVADGKVLSLIGPNGSGKSTMFNIINGVYQANGGRVMLDDRDITATPQHEIARLGVSRTFQMTRVFPNLTVMDNLLLGRHVKVRSSVWSMALALPGSRREEIALRESARRTLRFIGLDNYRDESAGRLSIGQRRIMQLGMALASEPKILMLDEPAAGLSPPNASKLVELIHTIRQEWKIGILLVEHAMSVVMAVSDRVAVLNFGRLIAEGTPDQVRNDPAVIEAYLGTEHH